MTAAILRPLIATQLVDDDAERVRRNHHDAIAELQAKPASGMMTLAGVTLADGAKTPIAHGLGRAPRWHATSTIRGLAKRISSASTAVAATTLTDTAQAMTTNAYAGGHLTDFSGQRYPILSNTATVFGLSSNGAVPTAGAYVAIPAVGTIVEIRDGSFDSSQYLALMAFGWSVTITIDLAVL